LPSLFRRLIVVFYDFRVAATPFTTSVVTRPGRHLEVDPVTHVTFAYAFSSRFTARKREVWRAFRRRSGLLCRRGNLGFFDIGKFPFILQTPLLSRSQVAWLLRVAAVLDR